MDIILRSFAKSLALANRPALAETPPISAAVSSWTVPCTNSPLNVKSTSVGTILFNSFFLKGLKVIELFKWL